jgi:hypothetical protein
VARWSGGKSAGSGESPADVCADTGKRERHVETANFEWSGRVVGYTRRGRGQKNVWFRDGGAIRILRDGERPGSSVARDERWGHRFC